jgi:hypothetical protein
MLNGRIWYYTAVIFAYNSISKISFRKTDLEILKTTFLSVTQRALSNHAKKIGKQKLLLKFQIAGTLHKSLFPRLILMESEDIALNHILIFLFKIW